MIHAAESLVASILRGDRALFIGVEDPIAEDAVLEAAADHDVHGLLRHVLVERGVWAAGPSQLRAVLDARTRALLARFPDRFKSEKKALTRVADLSEKYGAIYPRS